MPSPSSTSTRTGPFLFLNGQGLAMTPDGDRFLVVQAGTSQASEQELVLVQNFFEVLREQVGN